MGSFRDWVAGAEVQVFESGTGNTFVDSDGNWVLAGRRVSPEALLRAFREPPAALLVSELRDVLGWDNHLPDMTPREAWRRTLAAIGRLDVGPEPGA